MARPRKPEAERRNRTISVGVTTAEAAEIAERAGAVRITKGRLHAPQGARAVSEAAVHRLGARERGGLHRIGVNLNQIARALNSRTSAPAGALEAVERVGELAGRRPTADPEDQRTGHSGTGPGVDRCRPGVTVPS